jgi:hypothetical protein
MGKVITLRTKAKLAMSVPDDLFELLAFDLCGATYRDAYSVLRFCNIFKIEPTVVINKIIERCPTFSEMTH